MIKSWYSKWIPRFFNGAKMIILENPYVSNFLIEAIKKNKFSVLS